MGQACVASQATPAARRRAKPALASGPCPLPEPSPTPRPPTHPLRPPSCPPPAELRVVWRRREPVHAGREARGPLGGAALDLPRRGPPEQVVHGHHRRRRREFGLPQATKGWPQAGAGRACWAAVLCWDAVASGCRLACLIRMLARRGPTRSAAASTSAKRPPVSGPTRLAVMRVFECTRVSLVFSIPYFLRRTSCSTSWSRTLTRPTAATGALLLAGRALPPCTARRALQQGAGPPARRGGSHGLLPFKPTAPSPPHPTPHHAPCSAPYPLFLHAPWFTFVSAKPGRAGQSRAGWACTPQCAPACARCAAAAALPPTLSAELAAVTSPRRPLLPRRHTRRLACLQDNTTAAIRFMDYATQKKDVWFVTMSQLVDWMKNPGKSQQPEGCCAARSLPCVLMADRWPGCCAAVLPPRRGAPLRPAAQRLHRRPAPHRIRQQLGRRLTRTCSARAPAPAPCSSGVAVQPHLPAGGADPARHRVLPPAQGGRRGGPVDHRRQGAPAGGLQTWEACKGRVCARAQQGCAWAASVTDWRL